MTTDSRGLVMRASSGRRLAIRGLQHRARRADASGNMAPLPNPPMTPSPAPEAEPSPAAGESRRGPVPRRGLGGLGPHLRAGVPALIAVALMLVWAIQNGGF